MTIAKAQGCEWVEYVDEAFTFAEFPPGARVLDIGFGTGGQMRRLNERGCRAFGLDLNPEYVARGRASGLSVCRAVSEALPFETSAFDGVICKVVVPYTDEAAAVREIARVLRPGGIARVSYHGLGYSLRYLFGREPLKRRVYGGRVIVNTILYILSGRRLPGFWGDTLYQSDARLRRYYERAGLELVEPHPSPRFMGAPVFIYHVLRRR
jgi:SAM-dependent methyltransferase